MMAPKIMTSRHWGQLVEEVRIDELQAGENSSARITTAMIPPSRT